MNTRPTPEQVQHARTVVTGIAWFREHFSPEDVARELDTAWAVLRLNAMRPRPVLILTNPGHAPTGGAA